MEPSPNVSDCFFGHVPDPWRPRYNRKTNLKWRPYLRDQGVPQPDSQPWVAAGMKPRMGHLTTPPTFRPCDVQTGRQGLFSTLTGDASLRLSQRFWPSTITQRVVRRRTGLTSSWATNGDGGKKIWLTEIGAPTSCAGRPRVSVRTNRGPQITEHLVEGRRRSGFSGAPGVHFSPSVDIDTRRPGQTSRDNYFGALLTSRPGSPRVAGGPWLAR